MSDLVYTYIHKALEVLDNKIDYIRDNYEPINATISGNLVSNGNTTIGSDDSDLLTVNAIATFNNDLNGNVINVNDLNIIDNTVIGQDNTDMLTINSSTVFALNSSVEFNGEFNVTGNAVFGTDYTNTVECSGNISAKHFDIPIVSGNSLKVGSDDVIVYIESSSNIDIYTDYPKSVIVVVKNTSNGNISITYNSNTDYDVQSPATTRTYLKTSSTSFVLITSGIA